MGEKEQKGAQMPRFGLVGVWFQGFNWGFGLHADRIIGRLDTERGVALVFPRTTPQSYVDIDLVGRLRLHGLLHGRRRGGCCDALDGDEGAICTSALEGDDAVDERIECVIAAHAYVAAWVRCSAALADDDVACANELAAEFFDAQATPDTISIILG